MYRSCESAKNVDTTMLVSNGISYLYTNLGLKAFSIKMKLSVVAYEKYGQLNPNAE